MKLKTLARGLLAVVAAVPVAAISWQRSAPALSPVHAFEENETNRNDTMPRLSPAQTFHLINDEMTVMDTIGEFAKQYANITNGASPQSIPGTGNKVATRSVDTPQDTLIDAAGQVSFQTTDEKRIFMVDQAQDTLIDAAKEIARAPVDVLRLGMPVLTAKARIASDAFTQALKESMEMLSEGDLSGALKAASIAIARYQKTSEALDEGTSMAASRSVGILMVFFLVTMMWGLQQFLERQEKCPEHPEQSVCDRDLGNKSAAQGKPFFSALSFTRYLFCMLGVVDNFYNPGRQKSSEAGVYTIFARWGCLAWPWFFLVSGFSNSFSKMVGRTPDAQEDWFPAMIKRVATWYPFYAITLAVCAAQAWTITAEDWSEYLAHTMLVSGIIWNEQSFPKSMVGQWLSYLTVYMMAWSPMYQVFYQSTNSVIWTLFTMSCLIVIPSAIMEWFFFADAPQLALLQYWPTFCFGQALATWLVRNCMEQRAPGQPWVIKPVREISLWVRFGPTLGFLVLGIFAFSFSPYDRIPLLRKPVAPLILKGGLLPLMGIMVAGMAIQVDPISKLFARAPFRWAEKICLMTFVLQKPVYTTMQTVTGYDGLTWTYVSSLVLTAILAHAFLEQPWRAFLRIREK